MKNENAKHFNTIAWYKIVDKVLIANLVSKFDSQNCQVLICGAFSYCSLVSSLCVAHSYPLRM